MVKDDLAYIEHILDCIRKINEFSNGLSLKVSPAPCVVSRESS